MTETDTFKIPSVPIEETKPSEISTTTEESPAVPLGRHKGLQYDVPDSSSISPHQYALEVLRNGTIVDNIDLCQRAYTVFGRAPDSDVILENPTISRYHAIIQYKSEFEHGQPAGLYLYDCGSTHGTFINKKRIESKVYVRIKIGHLIKFGQSTRLYIVQGDSSIDEDTTMSGTGDDVTHEQMKKFHAKRAKALASVRAKRESMANEANGNVTEMDWGMGPDIDETAIHAAVDAEAAEVLAEKHRKNLEQEEEIRRKSAADDLKNRIEYQKAKSDQNVLKEIMSRVDAETSDQDDSTTKKEPFYLKDPKRALTTFFEREGAELVYDVEDHQFGSYRCTIKLPIVDEFGRPMQAECEEKHCKRKEIVQKCILEACRLLDEHGVLRDGTAASALSTPRIQQIKRQMLEENDFYEEDEDTFYDRTGDLEKKRLKRMEWAGHVNQEKNVETFDSLKEKLKHLYEEQVDLEEKLRLAKEMEENAAKNAKETEKDIDEVDLYIRQLKQGEKVNIKVKWEWKKRLLEIENEERQWVKLLKVCKPKEFEIPKWREEIQTNAKEKLKEKKVKLPLPSRSLPPPPPPPPVVTKEESTTPKAISIETKSSMGPPAPPPSRPESVVVPKVRPPVASVTKKSRRNESKKDQYDDAEHYTEENFAEWMPPDDQQTGDGRTALNDKYGY